jgi:hypothetical protein
MTAGGPNRNQGRKALKPGEATRPVTINLASSQAAKLKALGGAPWVREQIDAVRLPETETSILWPQIPRRMR